MDCLMLNEDYRMLPPERKKAIARARERSIVAHSVEVARRESLGPAGRAWEDYSARWPEMARGERIGWRW